MASTNDINDIKDVTNETEGIKEQLYTSQGKIARLVMKNQELVENLLSHETKSYERDLMFYNLDDTQQVKIVALLYSES